MRRLSRLITTVISVLLATLMSFLTPINCVAAGGKQVYISDVRMAYGKNGMAELKEAGYTVWEGLNANAGGNGDAVWLGYKTTDNRDEGITDMAVMNMTGGYGVEDYRNEIRELNNSVSNMLKEFNNAIAELKQNKDTEFGKVAVGILNRFYDDDSLIISDGMSEEEKKKAEDAAKVGNILTADKIDANAVHRIFMEGNTQILDVIENAVALGLTEKKGSTFLDRLKKADYDDELDSKLNAERNAVITAIEILRLELDTAKEFYQKASAVEGGKEAYFKSLQVDEIRYAAYYLYLYEAARNTPYGNTGMSLYEVFTLPTDEPEDDSEDNDNPIKCLDINVANMLATSLTTGQLGVMGSVGLASLITNAYSLNAEKSVDNAAASSNLDFIKTFMDGYSTVDNVSVYSGVERDLFFSEGDIAFTTEVERSRSLGDTTDFGQDFSKAWLMSETARIVIPMMVAISSATTIGCGVSAVAMQVTTETFSGPEYIYPNIQFATMLNRPITYLKNRAITEITQDMIASSITRKAEEEAVFLAALEAGEYKAHPEVVADHVSFDDYIRRLKTGLTVVAAVSFVATITFTILTIMKCLKKIPIPEMTYYEIPRAMIGMSADSNNIVSYYAYYAVKLITAKPGEKNTLALYGDLNSLNKTDEWLALYITKDSRLGNPLTPNIIVSTTDGGLNLSQLSNYRAIHRFGGGAADLNFCNSSSSAGNLYVYFGVAADANNTSTGSIFNFEDGIICVSSLLAGGLFGFGASYIIKKMRSKSRKAQAV